MLLLRDAGLPANPGRVVETAVDARVAARELGFPVALKTAGVDHKSEQDGVRLDIRDEAALAAAFADLAGRLGSRVLVAPMAAARGVELMLGMVHDEQFGPVVLLGAGGLHVEALSDVAYALPPFDAATARRLLDGLAIAPLLGSRRHRRQPAVAAFCEVAARFSALVAVLGGRLAEVDLNPVIVHPDGCAIVDALVLPRQAHNRQETGLRKAQ